MGITVAACFWWSYFDWVVYVAQARLGEATGERRSSLARDAYSYLHLPMVGGIVLFAFGLKTTLAEVGRSVLLFGLLPVATRVPALAALRLVAAVCVGLIVYEDVRHREARAWIRSRRGAFTMEEASRMEPSRQRNRLPRAEGSHDAGGDAPGTPLAR